MDGRERPPAAADDELAPASEPPVVARLVVEIRSDGSRTIARGAIEDNLRGERVAVQAEGRTPAALALALARAILKTPVLSGVASGASSLVARALLPGRGREPRR